ncbi:hypothetical protein HED60_06500 [Planctomycetales bacterium ZRK34]|nr:hypothetical protein HED60_06500 [Planctomycetales bacterium ZRK34]
MMMTRRITIGQCLIAGMLSLGVAAGTGQAADVGTGFESGAGSANPDEFPGTAGDGWVGAWTGTGTSSSLTNASPIDVNNYASVERSSSGDATLRRQFDLDAGNMVSGEPYQVEWFWRFDGDTAQQTTFSDRIHFFGNQTAASGSSSSNSWLMGVGSSGTVANGNWYIYDRVDGAFNASNMIDSGITLATGDIYKFKVIVDAAHARYDATIMNLTSGETYTAARSTFRNNSTNAATTQWLHFGSSADSASDNTTFSLDTLAINAHHKIVANFDDGNTANTIDTYTDSTGGGGWANGWINTAGNVSATVSTTTPLEGAGDPYLSVSGGDTGNRTIARQITDFGSIDPGKTYTINWKWRFDGDVSDLSVFEDRIHFFGDNGTEGGTGSGASWLIGWVAADGGGNNIHDGNWYFYDNNGSSSFNTGNMVDTGLGLVADEVYEFFVTVNPLTGMYDATIIVGGTEFTATGLTFRNGLTGEYNYLHFGTSASSGTDDTSFSLDSLSISVPEPGTALIALAVAPMLIRRRRH